MNRFAELLDRLAYEPGRNNKLRLLTALFPRRSAIPTAAMRSRRCTGALSLQARQAGADPRSHRGADGGGGV